MSFIKTYGRCYQKFDNDPIIKTDPTYTAPTTKENLEYTGLAQALLNAGSTSDGTIQYSSNDSDWSNEVPVGTNAGNYTLYWKLVGDANHSDVAPTSVVVSIAKVSPTYTAPTGKENLEYTGEAQSLLNAGSTNDGVIKYSLDGTNWGTSVPTGTEAQTYTVYWKLEGDANHNDVAQATISVEITSAASTVNFVDLGLPSGKLWADRNLGADNPEDAGLYYAWGETTGYANAAARNTALGRSDGFSSNSYTATGASAISADLTLAQDAANVVLGGNYRMPTEDEFQELINNTNNEWVTINGVNGRKFINKSDSSKYIFIPAAACYEGVMRTGNDNNGFYWSTTICFSQAYRLYFHGSGVGTTAHNRYNGLSIRPIQDVQ